MNWSVRSIVDVSPAQIAFTEDFGAARVVTLKASGPVTIGQLVTSDPAITACVVPGDQSDVVQLKIAVEMPPGQQFFSGSVTVRVTAPEATEVRIPVTAFQAVGQ